MRWMRRKRVESGWCGAAGGVAAFNIQGHTLHSLFSLPTKGDFKDLEGERLHKMQQSLANMKYLIIDEVLTVHTVQQSLCQQIVM